jgi:cobalt-zinc-cadmium efflux system outer membrane protein
MFRRFVPLLVLALGCRSSSAPVPAAIEGAIVGLAPPGATVEIIPCQPAAPSPLARLDLPALWSLALSHNPGLREAAAAVEAARGRAIQAGLYPNPRVRYNQDTIGSNIAPAGNISIEVNQEIVTAGKRKLDRAIAATDTSVASVGLVGRKFETLTRIRRAYYDYLSLLYTLRVNRQAVETLQRGVEVTRRQVEEAKARPRTDLIRLEALLAEARINRDRTTDTLEGAWRQLAAEVGVPCLAVPDEVDHLAPTFPEWEAAGVLGRVLGVNASLRQATVQVERARLAVERARAGAIPNVTVGAGYNVDNTDMTSGGLFNLEAPLPVWDRQQGVIREAQAHLASARAAVRSTENRLAHDTAEAFARYQAGRRQVERLTTEVVPRLREGLDLTLRAYQAGSAQVTFSDVLTAEQNLNSTRLTLAEARRSLWQAIADLQGLMQLDVGEEGTLLDGPCRGE